MPEDVEWFDQALAKLVEEELIEEHQNIVDYGLDRYFVDFLRDAPEATGTANQKKNIAFLTLTGIIHLSLYCDPCND